MLFGEHYSSLSLSARQSSRVLCGGCSPPASSRKREGKTKDKNSFTLCAASTYSTKRRCFFQAWHDSLVAAHGVLQLSFGAGALQAGRARCGWKAPVTVCGLGAEKAWGWLLQVP